METKKISDKVAVGRQPSAEQLAELRAQGFATVVNLRTAGEKNQSLSPADEEAEAKSAGLSYHHIPVAISSLDAQQVEAVREAIRNSEGPVYVHCGAGQRACAISLLATESGGAAGHLVTKARDLGFPVVDDELRTFIEGFARKPEGNE
ncbi:beta-lactamase hydrolase domain-containing protein [Azospirillum brasilense]|uniref:beta-lactamase hydrolase domain-containing protein n=1 Tax=Azospirillum brasilense TaxID=192 RepID=UPI001EDC81CB|nr:protein tyrosine phosphatase family protein [Azospirillum brasilense]UKJ76634.1 protein tyrosine phosphatase family protein [Azospirillum brasilense]